MGQASLLDELHDAYVWAVNAAVGEHRMDLVRELSDEYADTALQLLTVGESPGCGRPDCVICARRISVPTPPPRSRWSRRRWWPRTV